MAKQLKYYIEENVYNEAKKRIGHILDIFDNVIVCFSGGKDSLAVLSLVEEVYAERGITDKIKVLFRDEEIIPDSVVDFVKEKAESGKYDFRYYAVPLKSEKFILGKTYEYVQWDKNRKHLRTPPEYAITLPDGDSRVFSQYTMDEFCCKDLRGRVAMLTGIRAEESLTRFRSVINKKNENYICASKNDRIKLCKPIYDWKEQDIFIYFYKQKINYCPIYDAEMLNGETLRVATPLIANSAKKFHKVRTLYPTFYQQILDIFPEMKVQDMYWRSLSKGGSFDGYEHSYEGLLKYVQDTLPEADVPRVVELLRKAWVTRNNYLKAGKRRENLGGYPLLYLFKVTRRSGFSHLLAITPQGKATIEDFEFENLDINDYK